MTKVKTKAANPVLAINKEPHKPEVKTRAAVKGQKRIWAIAAPEAAIKAAETAAIAKTKCLNAEFRHFVLGFLLEHG